jgi:hypothetical protein
MRTNYRVRFGFCGSTVLVAYRGQDVSFYTTVGGDVLLTDKLSVLKQDVQLITS